MYRLQIEETTYNDYQWKIDVYDASDENAPQRIVTESELLAYLNADSLDRIPQVECAGQDDERCELVSLTDWLDNAGICGLYEALEGVINSREKRTVRAPFKESKLAEQIGLMDGEALQSLIRSIAA